MVTRQTNAPGSEDSPGSVRRSSGRGRRTSSWDLHSERDTRQPSEQEPRDAELIRLRREVRDLKIALQTSNEHGDLLQEHLHHLSVGLKAEVRERQAAEQKLQALVEGVTKEKADLEILVQILIDQGDDWAEEGGKARIDALTRIANRRRFDEYLAQEWAQHVQRQQPLSLLICDVDHFKLYNDHYGHQQGDECLRTVARTIGACLRAEDLVARYGGEEFAIVLLRTDMKTAVRVAERVRSAVADAAIPHRASPVCERVTLSVGVACRAASSEGEADVNTLIEESDRHLYIAKRSGRNRVAHSEESSKP